MMNYKDGRVTATKDGLLLLGSKLLLLKVPMLKMILERLELFSRILSTFFFKCCSESLAWLAHLTWRDPI